MTDRDIPTEEEILSDYNHGVLDRDMFQSETVIEERFRRFLAKRDIELAAELGFSTFGTHIDHDGPLEFTGTGEDGMPIWERPVPVNAALMLAIRKRLDHDDVPLNVAADIEQILWDVGGDRTDDWRDLMNNEKGTS